MDSQTLTQTDEELKSFLEEVKIGRTQQELDLISKAYLFSKKAHQGMTRLSGEPFFTHPLSVTRLLIPLGADTTTICSSLLHDIIEDCQISPQKLQQEFDEEITNIIQSLSKIKDLPTQNLKSEKDSETLRKILLASSKDIRVLLIKLADRLHNMQTLKYLPVEKQKKISKETLEVYAPISHKLGMHNFQEQLEDLSLKYLEPQIYQQIKEFVNQKREEREAILIEIENTIKQALAQNSIQAHVYGRVKSFYSIYKKTQLRGHKLEEIHDLIALRIIVNQVEDCYKVLGIIHNLFKPIPEHFSDYIANPKPNGYQSIHTKLIYPKSKNAFEVQIRTHKMHQEAEHGIAAHWRYKNLEEDEKFERYVSWLKEFLEWKKEIMQEAPSSFIESLKVDVFGEEIFCFTPKGDAISLPVGSTPVDFAFAVHSDIGNKCIGATANDIQVPLSYTLKSGDVIKIITNNSAKPSRQWLSFIKTQKARSKIKAALGITADRHIQRQTGPRELKDEDIHQIILPHPNFKKHLAGCCHPLDTDELVAVLLKSNEYALHKKSCENTRQQENSIPIQPLNSQNKFIIRISSHDRVGLLADVLNQIAKFGGNVKGIKTRIKHGLANIAILIELTDNSYLPQAAIDNLLQVLRSINSVLDVQAKSRRNGY